MRTASVLIALACVVAAAPAAAQEDRASLLTAAGLPAPIAGKIAAAMAQATSYRIRISTAAGTGGVMTVIPAQKRTRLINTDPVWGSVSTEMIFADGRGYARTDGGEWRVLERPQRAAGDPSPAKTFVDMTKIAPLPDRVEHGVVVGAYQLVMHVPSLPGSADGLVFTCTYDKTTYLPLACANDVVTETYEGWNDPANVIDVPVVAAPNSR